MDYELLTILLPAFAAGILVLSTHVVLGKQVLRRGIIFIDLAIAQIAALGAIVVRMDHDLAELAYAPICISRGRHYCLISQIYGRRARGDDRLFLRSICCDSYVVVI